MWSASDFGITKGRVKRQADKLTQVKLINRVKIREILYDGSIC